jgi:acetyl-CoA C-acetyltransferase
VKSESKVKTPVILSAARLPTGRFLGALKSLQATDLGALAVRAAVERAGVDPATVDECIFGNVLSAGLGQNPARQAALHGGLGENVGALTINKVCGSGLKAVMLAAQAVSLGDADIVVAGGMESMSNAPYLLPRAREGLRMGDATLVDAMVNDGLWCAFEHCHMGVSGEYVAERYGVSRDEQDAFAAMSHQRAARASADGLFESEIVPAEVPQPKGAAVTVAHDETIRPDSTPDTLKKLKPAFKSDGTITAGNAPGVNDGAAAVLVTSEERAASLKSSPMARIVGHATTGLAPKLLLMTPVESIRKVLGKVGWGLADVDLFEINEAFAAQMVAIIKELRVDPERVNVHGGAIALGHPIGASGARVLTTLLYAMKQRGARKGVASLCLGGGNGVAMAVEM